MSEYIVMPKLGLTMTEGNLTKWYKKEGDAVKKGDKMFIVETDKLTNDVEATQEGVLRKILLEEGIAAVMKPVAIIANADEDISDMLNNIAEVVVEKKLEKQEEVQKPLDNKNKKRIKASPKAKKIAKEKGIELEYVTGSGAGGSISEKDILSYEENQKKAVKSSPTAKKIAEQLNVNMNDITKCGRIMKDDVIKYWNFEKLQDMAEPTDKKEKLSSMRKVISERMSSSQEISATVNYTISVDTRELARMRTQLKMFTKITYTDLLVKILSQILLEYPVLNSSLVDDEIIYRNYVNIGVAVALEDGLLVPVVKYANVKGLRTISNEIKTLANKSKTNDLEPDDMVGGTFTITNLGKFGMEAFTPIINQPEVAILGINTIKDVATNVDGNLVFVPMMSLSLTADHRVVDGSVAAQFLSRLKDYIENPITLLL